MGDCKMNFSSILKALEAAATAIHTVSDTVQTVSEEKPYGFIHKQAFITYMGCKGRLVWDYIVWNELTFENHETGKKYSLGNSFSDKETEQFFNELVQRFGTTKEELP